MCCLVCPTERTVPVKIRVCCQIRNQENGGLVKGVPAEPSDPKSDFWPSSRSGSRVTLPWERVRFGVTFTGRAKGHF